MAVPTKAIDDLKSGPKDQKTAVAGGIAVSVVIVLLVMWGFWFVKRIQHTQQINLSAGAQDEFNFTSVIEAREQLAQQYESVSDELKNLPYQAASKELQGQQVQQPAAPSDQFGMPTSSE